MPVRVLLPALLGILLAASPASAQELLFGARSNVGWTDNLFGGAGDKESDFSLRIQPQMEARDPQGEWTWHLAYRPTYEYFLDFNELAGWDHDLEGEVEWRARPTTTLSVSDRFSRFQSIAAFNEVAFDETGDAITESVGQRNRFKRNVFQAKLVEMLNPTRQVDFSFSWILSDFGQDRSDRENFAANARWIETVTRRDQLGATLGWRRQIFEGLRGVSDRETDYYTVTAVWQHTFDPTFEFFASVGPAWVNPRTSQAVPRTDLVVPRFPVRAMGGGQVALAAASCPRLDDGTAYLDASCEPLLSRTGRVVFSPANELVEIPFDTRNAQASGRLTFFADVNVSKRWETWSAQLSYRRQEDDAGGVGFSALADIVSGQVIWRPSPRWRFLLAGSWIRQTQSTESFAPVIAVRSGTLEAITIDGMRRRIANPLPGIAEAFAVRGLQVDDEFERTQITIRFAATYRLTKRVSLTGNVFYLDSDADRDSGVTRQISRFRVALGVSYRFEPIRL